MRFILVEGPSYNIGQLEKELSNKDLPADKRMELLVEYLAATGKSGTELYKMLSDGGGQNCGPISDAVLKSIEMGKAKEFIDILCNLNLSSLKPFQCGNLSILLNLSESADVKLSGTSQMRYLKDISLYTRDSIEFEYSVRICDAFCDSSKLTKYFPPEKAKEIKIDDLFVGGKLKEAGFREKESGTHTIYGTVEALSGKKPSAGNKSGKTDSKEDSKENGSSDHKTYKSIDDIPDDENLKFNVVHIDGDYEFNGKDWEPVKG